MTRTARLSILGLVFALCALSAIVQRRLDGARQAAPPNQLFEVVRRQITAFQADDYASAYRQASTGFQERFNIEAFSQLAHSDYPGLSRSSRVEFGAVRYDGRHALVPVYFFVPGGDVLPCIYSLINEDNTWKIDGARVLKRWPSGRRLGGMRS